ncbi:hypothetical protein [Roseivirga sp.]|uniref:hypothetical protein n=1 Tax=Roseivirga sp. TaxID=1964215 RepID=UPI003B52AC10
MREHIYSQLGERFFVLDYNASHRQLLIRSKKHKGRDHNIDIIFKGVVNLLMSTEFDGFEISTPTDSDVRNVLGSQYLFKQDKNYLIFKIDDKDGYSRYLNAMCFGVYHNELDILESSIGRYDIEDLGENILWYD